MRIVTIGTKSRLTAIDLDRVEYVTPVQRKNTSMFRYNPQNDYYAFTVVFVSREALTWSDDDEEEAFRTWDELVKALKS